MSVRGRRSHWLNHVNLRVLVIFLIYSLFICCLIELNDKIYFILQVISREFHYHNKEKIDTTEDVREAARFCHPYLKMVEISRYCNICDFEIFKQIIENFVNLEKIIIDTCDPDRGIKSDSESESKEDQRELQRSSLEQQLRAQLSPRVELVML